jgi:hypothetical protein
MTSLRDQTGTYEIILAAFAAAGLVLMMISPVAGKVIVLISLILAALCYVRCSLMVINFAEEDRFTRLVLMVNMLASAVVTVLLFLVITWQAANPVAGIAAAGVVIICIALNLAHKYIYQIKDENYSANQVRLMILLALALVFIMAGG